ncbi:MAG TPA: DNRLRE domain-containing protein, partial [Candidatus Limnocylindria bacterium]
IAGDDHSRFYLHNAFTLGAGTGPPETTITSGPSGDITETTAIFTFVSSTPGGTFECSLDGAPTAGCSSPATYSGLALGAHTFDVQARDSSGTVDPSPAHADWTIVSGGGGTTTQLEVSVAASSDDAEQWQNGGVNLTSSDLELVDDSGRGNQIVGMRFAGLTVPNGAAITDAWIQFQADEASSGATSLTFQAEAVDDAATFTTSTGSIGSRPRTTASVTWSPPAWNTVGEAGADQRTPSLSGPLQEVVGRSGWAPGNALAIIVTGSGTRLAEAWDGSIGGAPRLHVSYSSDPPDPPTISGIDPTGGPPGTSVTFSGTNFVGTGAVTFNGTAASFTVDSDVQLTTIVPGAATSGPVAVTTGGGTATGPDFTVTEPPPTPAIRVPADHPTIQAAIDVAQDGDVILVAPGTYSESIVISGKNITLASQYYETPDPALIGATVIRTDGLTDAITIDTTSGAGPTIFGLTVTDPTGLINDGIIVRGSAILEHNRIVGFEDGIDFKPPGTTLATCLCRDNTAEFNRDDGIDLNRNTGGVFEGNTLRNNGEDGIELRLTEEAAEIAIAIRDNLFRGNGQDGIQLVDELGASNRVFTVERNRFIDNGRAAIGLMDNGSSSEDYRAASLPDRINLFNNTFSGNNHALSGGDNVIGLNNIFAGSSGIAAKGVDGGSLLAYSLFWNNGTDVSATNLDPATTLFADPLLDSDHILLPGSPAIDAGVASYIWNGQSVLDLPPSAYLGSAPDLGALEFDPIGPQTAITSGPPDPSASPDATFAFTSSVANSTFECALDGGAFAACSSPAAYAALPDGARLFEVRAVDPAGNPDLSPASWSWTVDTTTPAAPLITQPAEGATITTRVFTLRGTSEAGATIRLQSDGTTATTTVTAADGTWATVITGLTDGPHSLTASATDRAGNVSAASAPHAITVALAGGDPVVAAAGDIACDRVGTTDCRQVQTSDLLLAGAYDAVLTTGDHQYECGSATEFAIGYEPSWGRVKAITRPSVGNHEYLTTGGIDCDPVGTAADYFDYFGAAAGTPGEGWYSYELGDWHLVALNSNCAEVGGCDAGSPQEQWLRADLAASTAPCTLAYWHHARWSSGSVHGNDPATQALVEALYEHGAELLLAGHDHDYERFAPQDPSGAADTSTGIRAFVVGTGGRSLRPFGAVQPHSEFRAATDFGILELTLGNSGYGWSFMAESGAVLDSGSAGCHDAPGSGDTIPPETTIESGPPDPSASADATFAFDAGEPGSTFACALDAGAFSPCTSPATYSGLADGTHTFEVQATDPAANTDPTPASWSWTIDTAPPSVVATTPLDGATDVGTATAVTATFDEQADPASVTESTFTLAEGATPVPASVSYDGTTNVATLTPSTALGHSLTFLARLDGVTDLAGNPLPVVTWSFTTVADTIPPETTIESGPPDPSASADATFAFDAGEPGSTFACALDVGAFSPCTSPATYSGLADGTHTFEVQATDPAANTDPTPASWSWTIDTSVPPEPTTVTFNPDADSSVRQASPGSNFGSAPTLVSDGADGGGATEAVLRFPVSGISGPVQQALLRIWVTNKANGGPNVHLSDPGWDESLVTWSNRPALLGGAVASSGAIATGWYEFDVTSAVTGDGPLGFALVPTSSDGLDFSSREGSVRPQLVVTFAGSDTTPPETTILSGPSGVSSSSSATFEFTSSELNSTFACSLDGAPYGSCTSPATNSGLANGDHTFAVRATDASGNADPTPATSAWTILAATSATFLTGADSYADEQRSTSNFGTSTTLESDGDGGRANEAFMRFVVTGVSGQVLSARVRIWVTNSTVDGPRIHASDTAWVESTVAWTTRPALIGGPLADAGAVSSGGWYEYDVTALVSGDGTYSFSLVATSSDGMKFASRESGTPPELVIDVGS